MKEKQSFYYYIDILYTIFLLFLLNLSQSSLATPNSRARKLSRCEHSSLVALAKLTMLILCQVLPYKYSG